jgi:hypothetical protein
MSKSMLKTVSNCFFAIKKVNYYEFNPPKYTINQTIHLQVMGLGTFVAVHSALFRKVNLHHDLKISMLILNHLKTFKQM